MIRTLRRKFILVNMLLVSLVLLMVFGVFMASSAQRLKDQSLLAMRAALMWGEEGSPLRPEIAFPLDGSRRPSSGQGAQRSLLPVFTVTVEDGVVTAINDGDQVDVSLEVAQQAAQAALEDGRRDGTVSSLRYLREDAEGGAVRLAFADRTWERENLLALLRTCLLVGLLGLACFFVISLLLSTLALRPAERSWQQQKQFVADASHELKTPLTVILANAGILLAHSGDMADGQRKWVEYIQAEAQRMKSLVEDLLFLARSDDRRSPLRLQTVSFSDLAWEALLPFESVAFEAGVALDSQITPDLELLGDPEQLRRLVAILVDNAVKYAGPRGSASLILRPQGDEAVLSVHNTGEAIPPEHRPRLFERFYRTDSDRARSQGGYGLGLSIAKSIVDGHRGRISVSSSAISGTLFTVRLPLPGRGLGHLRTRSLG